MRLLHTMIRVGDLPRSIRFYTEVLGMKLLRRHDYPDGKFTLAMRSSRSAIMVRLPLLDRTPLPALSRSGAGRAFSRTPVHECA